MLDQYVNSPETIGLLAALLTTTAFLPQVIKTWKTKSADDVSLLMFFLFILGVLLWCIYGLEIHAFPIIIANAITFLLALTIVVLKLIFDSQKK